VTKSKILPAIAGLVVKLVVKKLKINEHDFFYLPWNYFITLKSSRDAILKCLRITIFISGLLQRKEFEADFKSVEKDAKIHRSYKSHDLCTTQYCNEIEKLLKEHFYNSLNGFEISITTF
jgi:hypothetical protein